MMQLDAAIDIPPEYGTLEKYRATLGHKGSYFICQKVIIYFTWINMNTSK